MMLFLLVQAIVVAILLKSSLTVDVWYVLYSVGNAFWWVGVASLLIHSIRLMCYWMYIELDPRPFLRSILTGVERIRQLEYEKTRLVSELLQSKRDYDTIHKDRRRDHMTTLHDMEHIEKLTSENKMLESESIRNLDLIYQLKADNRKLSDYLIQVKKDYDSINEDCRRYQLRMVRGLELNNKLHVDLFRNRTTYILLDVKVRRMLLRKYGTPECAICFDPVNTINNDLSFMDCCGGFPLHYDCCASWKRARNGEHCLICKKSCDIIVLKE